MLLDPRHHCPTASSSPAISKKVRLCGSKEMEKTVQEPKRPGIFTLGSGENLGYGFRLFRKVRSHRRLYRHYRSGLHNMLEMIGLTFRRLGALIYMILMERGLRFSGFSAHDVRKGP